LTAVSANQANEERSPNRESDQHLAPNLKASFGRDRPNLLRFIVISLVATQPSLQPIKVEINHRRGVERQQLAESKPAYHRITERLAQFRPRAGAERERHAGEHRCSRGHEDWTESQQARFAYRLERRHAVVALGSNGEVDQHDAVLLDDTDQQNDSDDPDHGQIHSTDTQGQQGTNACRRERRENRQRVNEALVQHAENDVDHDKRRADQNRRSRQRSLESLRITLEGSDHRAGHPYVVRRLGDCIHGLAERNTGSEIERESNSWKLALVCDGERSSLVRIDVHQRS